MDKIIFVVNSNKVHLYFWKCIQRIHAAFENIQITVFIDVHLEKQNNWAFNPVFKYIDSKYSNLKTNPFSLIDLNKETNGIDINISSNLNELELSDWVVLENKNDCQKFMNYSKNGLLHLTLNYENLIKAVINKSLIILSIYNIGLKLNKGLEVINVNLKSELGLKNSVDKLLHNYSIYLVKFLKNYNQTISSVKTDKTYKDSSSQVNNSLKLKLVIYYIKLLFNIFIRKIKSEQFNWKIGIKKNENLIFLKQPKKSFWADPFLINGNKGNLLVYFEELKSDNLGKIACVELNQNFEIIKKEDILDTNYHLSFPNVFFKEGHYYMIPESSQNNTLQLYKCVHFPFKWEFQMNLMENIKLLDAVWVYHDNLYWIFANKIEDFEHDNNEKLYLYYSNDLFSNSWQPHIKNPIVTNASLARNAGNFYYENGKLFRVSQNCLNGYGQNIVINEVTLLSRNEYMEEKVKNIFPVKGYDGSHTLNSYGNVSVLDFLLKE